jgi:WD40 repeat protein
MSSISTSYHSNLASYFASKPLYLDEPTQKKPNIRKLVEQPWLQTKGELWDEVTNTLCNLDFIQAKAAAKMTYELVNDFNTALEVIPDNAENIREEKERQARMDKYTQDLIACAKGEITIEELDIPESITPWTEEQIDAEIERIKTNPTRADILKDFLNFLGVESYNLQENASNFHNFTIQQAWNNYDSGPVGYAASIKPKEGLGKIMLCIPESRPHWTPNPTFLKITSDGKFYTSYSITPNEEFMVSGSYDGICYLYQLKTGKQLKKLIGHTNKVNDIAITPDGQIAISASDDKTCILWDLINGIPLAKLTGHKGEVNAVAILPNGKQAISGSTDMTCILWDLITGIELATFIGHSDKINEIKISVDGKYAVSASNDKTCIIWDLSNKTLLKILRGHTWSVESIDITPSGKQIVSVSFDNKCIHWNIETGTPQLIMKGPKRTLEKVAITPDGKYVVAKADCNSCVIWDLKSGNRLKYFSMFMVSFNLKISIDLKYSFVDGPNEKFAILDVSRGKQNRNLSSAHEIIQSISISTLGKLALTSNLSGDVSWWNTMVEKRLGTITQELNRKLSRNVSGSDDEIVKSRNGCDGANKVLFLKNGVNFFVVVQHSGICLIFDVVSGKETRCLATSFKNIVADILPDGKHFVVVSEENEGYLYDFYNEIPLLKTILPTFSSNSFIITPDGKCAIINTSEGICIIWNLIINKIIKQFKVSSDSINCLALTPDGKKVIIGSRNMTLWDIKNENILFEFENKSEIKKIVTVPDGRYMLSISSSSCYLWDISKEVSLCQFISQDWISDISTDGYKIALGGNSLEPIFVNIPELYQNQELKFVTILRIWDYNINTYSNPLAFCPNCRNYYEPPISLLKRIINIMQEFQDDPNTTPCFEMPNIAWEDPILIQSCPKCHTKIRINPFFGSDIKGIMDFLSSQEREHQNQSKFEEAETAFKDENWDVAYNLYLKLVQQGNYDLNYLRFNMAMCRLSSMTEYNLEIINNINILMQLLRDKGANDKAQIIADKLKERLDTLHQQELLKKKAENHWWKKLF